MKGGKKVTKSTVSEYYSLGGNYNVRIISKIY